MQVSNPLIYAMQNLFAYKPNVNFILHKSINRLCEVSSFKKITLTEIICLFIHSLFTRHYAQVVFINTSFLTYLLLGIKFLTYFGIFMQHSFPVVFK